ncbi:MAG: dihydroorotate dehydrogenase electron transfer subunit [Candidatus Cloacimonetes bacterium]|nr:dihydroorotate dehydrogenase electron transfer subunit [Candidatus Cloacimonadota bacterium]
MDKRVTLRIADIVKECSDVRTYIFQHPLAALPGQFIMLTDFAGGEKPFSLAWCNDQEFAVTVKAVGPFTQRLATKAAGDIVSIRGAFGSSFFISRHRALLVGGGYGTPPLYFLARRLLEAGAEVTVVNGARRSDDLLFCDRFRRLGVEYHNITDTGGSGREGTSVNLAGELLKTSKFDYVYTAGPELMMKSLIALLQDQPCQFLMERYMKCAIGICGNCTVDPLGLRLCVEGPVLNREQVERITEFGVYHRDAAGHRIKFTDRGEKIT